MSRESPRNTAASVAARLLQRSRETGEDHQVLLTRYGLERLMYRLGRSESASRFVVKGAMMFLVWHVARLLVRPTIVHVQAPRTMLKGRDPGGGLLGFFCHCVQPQQDYTPIQVANSRSAFR